jgi:hypothetical protein
MESNADRSQSQTQNQDLVTVFESGGGSVEDSEVLMVHQLLESNGISSVLVGDNPLPTMAEAIRVNAEDAARARQLIAEALSAGPSGAAEAEAESEK